MQAKNPEGKTLPQDYLLCLCGQSLLGMPQSRAIPQQCLPPPRLGLALTDRLWWWHCAMLDEKPSSHEFLPLSSGSQKIQSVRTGQGSQRQTKQFAGCNASTAADRLWGIQRALPATHFPDSLQKPLLTHADLHATTPQQYRDQQHLEFCVLPKTVASNVVLALNRFSTETQTRRNVDLSHVRTMTQISEPRSLNSMLPFSWPFTQPNTRARMRGYIPFKMID